MYTEGADGGSAETHAVRLRELGELLRRTREEKHITVEEAVEATKVRGRYLQAIESGDLSVLPGKVYARGFIRSYADYLGLGGNELANLYLGVPRDEELPRAVQGQSAKSAPSVTGIVERSRRLKSGNRYPTGRKPSQNSAVGLGFLKVAGVVVVFTLAVVAYAVLGHTHGQPSSLQTKNQNAGNGTVATAKGSGAANGNSKGSKSGSANGTAQDKQPTSVKQNPNSKGTTGATAPLSTQASAVSLKPLGSSANSSEFAVATARPLVLTLLTPGGRCWISTTADGKVVSSYTVAQGQSVNWTAQKSLSIELGDVPVTHLLIDGISVPLGPNAGPVTYTFIKQLPAHS